MGEILLSRRSVWDDTKTDFTKGTHPGLLLQKCLEKQYIEESDNKKQDDSTSNAVKAAKAAKADLLKKTRECVENFDTEVYNAAFKTWKKSLDLFGDYTLVMKIKNRMIVGLGENNVLEAGLTLHHTYGVPWIPGSAVKGLTAHYCNEIYGEKDSSFKKGGDVYLAIFGTTDTAGLVQFHDAWILPEDVTTSFHLDVITPHHQDYYGNAGKSSPTDFDTPVPIPFLSVSGKFQFALSLDTDHDQTELSTEEKSILTFAKRLLLEALRDFGIGGKTSSGYGRMLEETAPQKIPEKPKREDVFTATLEVLKSKEIVLSFEGDGQKYKGKISSKKTAEAKEELDRRKIGKGGVVKIKIVGESGDSFIVELVPE